MFIIIIFILYQIDKCIWRLIQTCIQFIALSAAQGHRRAMHSVQNPGTHHCEQVDVLPRTDEWDTLCNQQLLETNTQARQLLENFLGLLMSWCPTLRRCQHDPSDPYLFSSFSPFKMPVVIETIIVMKKCELTYIWCSTDQQFFLVVPHEHYCESHWPFIIHTHCRSCQFSIF